MVKPSEMSRPLALTGITAHTQKHFTSSDKTQKEEEEIYIKSIRNLQHTTIYHKADIHVMMARNINILI